MTSFICFSSISRAIYVYTIPQFANIKFVKPRGVRILLAAFSAVIFKATSVQLSNGYLRASDVRRAINRDDLIDPVFTFVNDGLLLPEIGEGWKFVDAIVLRQSFVVDLDEVHAERVGVVVDLLQLLQHFVARGAATGVCKARQK